MFCDGKDKLYNFSGIDLLGPHVHYKLLSTIDDDQKDLLETASIIANNNDPEHMIMIRRSRKSRGSYNSARCCYCPLPWSTSHAGAISYWKSRTSPVHHWIMSHNEDAIRMVHLILMWLFCVEYIIVSSSSWATIKPARDKLPQIWRKLSSTISWDTIWLLQRALSFFVFWELSEQLQSAVFMIGDADAKVLPPLPAQ